MINRRALLAGLAAVSLPSHTWAFGRPSVPALLDDGWEVAAAESANLDPEALAELVDMIGAGVNLPNIHAVLIEHRGKLVFEHYQRGEDQAFDEPLGLVDHGPTTLHDIRSVTKSVTSLLLGIALDGDANSALDRPITSFFPDRANLDDALEAVTLHHVLTMTAGLAWNETLVPYTERNDFVRLLTGADPIGFVFSKEVRETPGDRWVYNSGLTELVAGVIENLTETPLTAYADETLFGPLGITHYEWSTPPAWGDGAFPSASAGLRMRARDLAKLGSLVLQGGQCRGRQIVPAPWIATSTMRHVQNNPWGPPGVYGYGYFWFTGTLLSGHRVIRASGWGDQRIYVLPELGLSITILAGNYHDGGGMAGERITGRIIRAVR